MKTIFYKRNGARTSRVTVRKAMLAYVIAKRTTGKLTGKDGAELNVSIQPEIADAIEKMREEDFADWSGAYTFKKTQ